MSLTDAWAYNKQSQASTNGMEVLPQVAMTYADLNTVGRATLTITHIHTLHNVGNIVKNMALRGLTHDIST